MQIPRIVISGTSGGAGKTTVSLGLARALTQEGFRVHPFKKGPDYIDTAWLARAVSGAASNLDPVFLDEDALARHFQTRANGFDIAIVEGNRGFFDGRDIAGSSSTAEVARRIDAPVILVVDITKMTRSTAAVVAGFKHFPGGERIAGVILNRSGGSRHAAIARKAVEDLAGVPVLGVLPRRDVPFITERRAGLVTVEMHEEADASLEATAAFFRNHADMAAILAIARNAPALQDAAPPLATSSPVEKGGCRVTIGVVRDGALWQYYDENLEALEQAGADLVFLTLAEAAAWPDLDALYLGGGDIAPYAAVLAENTALHDRLCHLAASETPIYAEQAGFFLLGGALEHNGSSYAMSGILPVNVAMANKPARLGYVDVAVESATPFFPQGASFKGHEYHYAHVSVEDDVETVLATGAAAASGKNVRRDGLVQGNVFGSCVQLYAPAVPAWAASFVEAARNHKRRR